MCDISDDGDTFLPSFLPSFPLTHQRPHRAFWGSSRQGTKGVQPPQHCTAGQQHPPPKPSNTEERVSPSLGNSPWELQEHRTRDADVDKQATKGSASNPRESTRNCCVPGQGHGSRQQWKWFSGSLCSHLPLDARGRSFPAPGALAQGGLTQTPWVRASLAALFSCPSNLIPVNHTPAVTRQPELSMFQSNTVPGRFSWLQVHCDNECTKSTSAKGL